MLVFASVNGAMGIVLVSPILEALTGPFDIGEVGAGLLITAFVAPAIVAVPVVGATAVLLAGAAPGVPTLDSVPE